MKLENKVCLDCGCAPTNHFLERVDAVVEHFFLPIIYPFGRVASFLEPIFRPLNNLIWPILIELLVKIKLAEVKNEPDEKNNWRSRVLWEEAKKRGIIMQEFRPWGRYVDSYFASFEGNKIFFDGLPRPLGKKAVSLNWMDNKAEMAKRFAKENIPVAKGGIAIGLKKALKIFNFLDKPVITKPVSGSRSRHTTIHINTEKELAEGWKIVRQLSPWVLVQEELVGAVYRATIVGGKLQAVLRRDPACVEGDGVQSIEKLVEEENKNVLRQGPLFHHLPIDSGAEKELVRQNLNWQSIPEKGKRIELGTKTSRGVGGALVDVTDITHPDNIILFEKIGTLLADPLVGIDFIIADIKKSWAVTPRCGVIECNSLPFVDLHHYPLQGQPRNVAGSVWNIIFPSSEPTSR